jgi:hypothetical protein
VRFAGQYVKCTWFAVTSIQIRAAVHVGVEDRCESCGSCVVPIVRGRSRIKCDRLWLDLQELGVLLGSVADRGLVLFCVNFAAQSGSAAVAICFDDTALSVWINSVRCHFGRVRRRAHGEREAVGVASRDGNRRCRVVRGVWRCVVRGVALYEGLRGVLWCAV